MSDLSMMIAADLDVCFDDWGVDVTLRSVVQEFDPQTQGITETVSDIVVQAVLGFSEVEPSEETALQHRSEQKTYFVRSEAYPFEKTTSNARLVHGGVEYDIEDVQESVTDLLILACRRRETE